MSKVYVLSDYYPLDDETEVIGVVTNIAIARKFESLPGKNGKQNEITEFELDDPELLNRIAKSEINK